MRPIHTARIEDRDLRRVIDDLKAALQDQDSRIMALSSQVQGQASTTQTVIERVVQSSSGSAASALESDETVTAPYPPRFEEPPTNLVLPGSVVAWAGPTIPEGWLECDGSSISAATYADLFDAIGYTWGGAGANFNLPDFSDRYLQGVSAGEALGTLFGATDHEIDLTHKHDQGTLAADSDGAHTHSVSGTTSSDGSHSHGGATGAPSATALTLAGAVAVASGTHTHTISADGTHSHTVSGTAASGGAHTHTVTGETGDNVYTDLGVTDPVDIRPQSAAVYWIIKT